MERIIINRYQNDDNFSDIAEVGLEKWITHQTTTVLRHQSRVVLLKYNWSTPFSPLSLPFERSLPKHKPVFVFQQSR